MKKIICMFLLIITLVCLSSSSFATNYTDTNDSKYIDAIQNLSDINVFEGYPDNTFLPKNNITRAELCKIVVKAFCLKNATSNINEFNDVDNSHWAYEYINITKNNNYIIGDGDGNFRPDDNISYLEVITIFVRGLGYNLDSENNWPKSYIDKANELELLKNINSIQSSYINREAAAQLLWNTINTETKTGGTIYDKNFNHTIEQPDITKHNIEYAIVTSDISYTDDKNQISIYDIASDKTFNVSIENTAGIQKGSILKFTKLLGTNEYRYTIVPNQEQVRVDANGEIQKIYSDKYIELNGTNIVISKNAKIIYIDSDNNVEISDVDSITDFDLIYGTKKDTINGIDIYNIIIAREYSVSL